MAWIGKNKLLAGEWPVILVMLTAFGPHVTHLPPWVLGWCALFSGLGFLARKKVERIFNRYLLGFLAFGGPVLCVLYYGRASGKDAGAAMLASVLALKPLELRTDRDRIAAILMAYFLILANLFYSDSFLTALYLLWAVLLTFAALHQIKTKGSGLKQGLWFSGGLMLQAAPLALILFLVFPRLPVGLPGLFGAGARIGFNEEMGPGDVTSLARSGEKAFQVEFKGKQPKKAELYWRGLVLWDFDGKKWKRGRGPRGRAGLTPGREVVEYQIILAPHDRKWMFSLDLPLTFPKWGSADADHVLTSYRVIKQKQRYGLKSSLGAVSLTPGPGKKGLALPWVGNDRARELARSWAGQGKGTEFVIERALNYYRSNGFVYTLNPPPLRGDTVDEFLFETRKGFCEHYASSFCFLMRAAGIPARVVIGYLGGEMNPYGEFMTVMQSDAHAWVEVWLENRGWVRIDPTGAVSPSRLEFGLAAGLPREEVAAGYLETRMPWLGRSFRLVRLGWDMVNYKWSDLVLGYDHDRQKNFFRRMGLSGRGAATLILAAALALAVAVGVGVLIYIRLHQREFFDRSPAEEKYYARLCARLEKAGIIREGSEGPKDFAARVADLRPDLAPRINDLTRLYIGLRYGRERKKKDLEDFIRKVRRFRVKKADR